MSFTSSRFTPSNLPAPLLERLFVARHDLLDELTNRVQRAAITTERNHSLVVGPRGAGKTHLTSLLHHRITQLADNDGVRVQAAWLTEDPYLVSSYRDLLAEIVDALGLPVTRRAAVHELETQLLEAHRNNGLIVVLAENFDHILHAIGEQGQHQLRHFLQHEPALLLSATTTAVTRDLNDEAWPFYGFFTTDTLRPLDVDQAAHMLQLIAIENGDTKLANYLDTDEAHARLRSIEHLAGGQPRIWAVLASALTVHGLNDLVSLLLTELDALTPYYQEQMARLSPLQRRTVAELIDAESAITVSELADISDIDQRTMAKTLGELKQRQWVAESDSPFRAWVDRRRTFYELAEPLARIAFQIKTARSTPIKLIVDFMKMWFDPDTVHPRSGHVESMYLTELERVNATDAVGSMVRGLRRLPKSRIADLELLETIDDALQALTDRNAEPLLALPVPLRRAIEERLDDPDRADFGERLDDVRSEIFAAALFELGNIPHERSTSWIDRAETWLVSAADRPSALQYLAGINGANWRFQDAQHAINALERLLGIEHRSTLTAWANLASSYWQAGRTDDAIEIDERITKQFEEILGVEHPSTLTAWANLASSYRQAGRTDDAIETFERITKQREEILGVEHPDTLATRHNLASLLESVGRTEEAEAVRASTKTSPRFVTASDLDSNRERNA